MMRHYVYGPDLGAWLVMSLFWLVPLGLVAWAVVRVLPGRSEQAPPPAVARPAHPDTPEEILDRRFARGEIDIEAYQAQRSALASARGAAQP
jgi:putative membrane protein